MEKGDISLKILQMGVDRSVSEKLNGVIRELSKFNKSLNESEKKLAQVMIMEMMKIACGDFFTKMEARIESKSVKSE